MALQKQFRGLQKFLGRYEAGLMPLNLGDTVTPTVDIQQWVEPFAITNGQSIDSGQIATPGQIADQVFIPEWMGIEFTLTGAQQAVQVNPVIVLSNTNVYGLQHTQCCTYTVAGTYHLGIPTPGLRVGEAVGVTLIGFRFPTVINGPIIGVKSMMFGRSYTV